MIRNSKDKNKKSVGLLGFCADPPHLGHLEIARLILKRRLADEVWVIPCHLHPFGKPMAKLAHRWRMAKLLARGKIKINDVEARRPGKSYTVDTAAALTKKYPNCRFFWILGSDIVESGSYKKWRQWKKLASLVKFLVVNRAGFKINKAPFVFTLVKGRISDISSTRIRERIRLGLPIGNLVPLAVKNYIKKYNLYKV